jgi:hypothetical protein
MENSRNDATKSTPVNQHHVRWVLERCDYDLITASVVLGMRVEAVREFMITHGLAKKTKVQRKSDCEINIE